MNVLYIYKHGGIALKFQACSSRFISRPNPYKLQTKKTGGTPSYFHCDIAIITSLFCKNFPEKKAR